MSVEGKDIILAIILCLCCIVVLFCTLRDGERRETVQPTTFWCIDEVEYVKVPGTSYGHVVPHFKPDGTLYTCE